MLTADDYRQFDVFEQLATSELVSFSESYSPGFNQLERFFPKRFTTAEVIRISDYDIDYNPTALAVAENAIAPLAQRPDFDMGYQDLFSFKLEMRLTDSQLRVLAKAGNDPEKREIVQNVFRDIATLRNSQAIARERIRAQALFTGKIEINENGFNPPAVDFGIDGDHRVELDLEKDDIIKKLHEFNKINRDSQNKILTRWIMQDEDLFKLQGNPTLRMALLGKTESETRSYLTVEEVRRAIQGYAGISIEVISDPVRGNYHYTTGEGANKKEVNFIPEKTSVLLPNVNLGNTIVGTTAEGLELGRAGVNLQNLDGVAIFSNYELRPVNFVATTVQRFTVIYPKAPATMIVTDTSSGE